MNIYILVQDNLIQFLTIKIILNIEFGVILCKPSIILDYKQIKLIILIIVIRNSFFFSIISPYNL